MIIVKLFQCIAGGIFNTWIKVNELLPLYSAWDSVSFKFASFIPAIYPSAINSFHIRYLLKFAKQLTKYLCLYQRNWECLFLVILAILLSISYVLIERIWPIFHPKQILLIQSNLIVDKTFFYDCHEKLSKWYRDLDRRTLPTICAVSRCNFMSHYKIAPPFAISFSIF